MNHQRANTLRDAFQACNVEPLEGADIDRMLIYQQSAKLQQLTALVRF